MLATSILLFALAAVGLADVPAGYKTVYLTSKVDAKLAIVPKTAVAGSIIQVSVFQYQSTGNIDAYLFYITVRLSQALRRNNGISKRAIAPSNWPVQHSVWMEALNVSTTDLIQSSDSNFSDQRTGKIWAASL